MSFTEKDFTNLNNENQIKKFIFVIRDAILNNRQERLEDFIYWFKKYNNEDFSEYKKDLNSLLNILLERIRKINPFLEDIPFDNFSKKKIFPIKVVLNDIRSPFNVGSILRTTECFGIDEVIMCGITPIPELNNKIKKTMKNSFINYSYCFNIIQKIKELKEEKFNIISLEKCNNSISISENDFALPLVLIIGNEEFGLSKEILELSDSIVHIDMFGYKNSLNVSVATGIALHCIVSKIIVKNF